MTHGDEESKLSPNISRRNRIVAESNRRDVLRALGTGVATVAATGVVSGQTSSQSNGVLMSAYRSEQTELTEQKIHALTSEAAARYREQSGSNELIPIGVPKPEDGQMIASYAVKIFDSGQARHQASLVSKDATGLELADAQRQTKDFVDKMATLDRPLDEWTKGGY